jgi:hypothetical protein
MSGRRPRRWSRCPLCGRPSNGRADVRCPPDRCPRDRGRSGVRTDRRPVSAAAASAVRTVLDPGMGRAAGYPGLRSGFEVSLWSASGVVVATEAGRWGRDGRTVGSARLAGGSAAEVGRRLVGAEAAAPRSPPGGPGSWSSAREPVGGWGSTRGSRCSQVHPGAWRPGRLPA